MKKLLISLASLAITSSATAPILTKELKTNHQKQLGNNDFVQNKLRENDTVKTVINKSLNNNQEDEKRYLIEGFDDPNLINKIQIELASIIHKDNKGVFIYQKDVDAVVSLNLLNGEISNFKGLEFFPNLKSLNVSNNKIPINLADFQLICHKIEVFNISGNQINGIDIIMYFTALKELIISSMDMEEGFTWDSLFLPLSNITTLLKLNLQYNNIKNISGLSNLISLTNLNLTYTNISDLSGLSNLTNLTELNLSYNLHISEFSPLSSLTNLINLDLKSSDISDISSLTMALTNLTNLTDLHLDSNDISDISSLSTLTNLKVLGLMDNKISDISSFSSLTNLTNLGLAWNDISDISSLSTLTNLTGLTLGKNKILDFSVLLSLKNLTLLNITENNISDLSFLSTLTNLTDLTAYSNSISDISALSTLTNLTYLNLESNSISDISALSTLTNLTSLNLKSNYIPNTDEAWAVLHQLPNYKSDWDNEEVRESQKKLLLK